MSAGEVTGPVEGALELATTAMPGEALLPLLLPRFRRQHPAIQVRAIIADAAVVAQRLVDGQVELGLVGGPFVDRRLEVVALAPDELALIARRDHPLTALAAVRARDLCRYPLVLRGEESGARAAVEAALASAGITAEQIQIAAELGSTEAVRRAVEAGLGVGFVSVCTLAVGGPAGEVRALPLAEQPPSRELLLLAVQGRPLSPPAAAFRAFLEAEETRREIASMTRLPAPLRPMPATEPALASGPDRPRVSPSRGLESDPLLPARGPTRLRLAREPRDADERDLARLMERAGGPLNREDLIARLADQLRRADPLASLPEGGPFRLELYREEATSRVDLAIGGLLAAGME